MVRRICIVMAIASLFAAAPPDLQARSDVRRITPDSLSLVDSPVELTCEAKGDQLHFKVWAGAPLDPPEVTGTLIVGNSRSPVICANIRRNPYKDGLVWAFSVSSAVIDSTIFSIGKCGPGWCDAYVFELGPLLKEAFRSTLESPNVLSNPIEKYKGEEPETWPYYLLSVGFEADQEEPMPNKRLQRSVDE